MTNFIDFCKSVSDLCDSCVNLNYEYDIHFNKASKTWELRIFGASIIPSALIKDVPKSRRFLVTLFPRDGREDLCLLVW